MHREVNLTKRVQTPQGMRYYVVVLSANGRVKLDAVLVKGKRIRLSVGKDAAGASSMRLRKETELNNGDATVPVIADPCGKYRVRYKMKARDAPWPEAFVEGKAPDEAAACRLILVAMKNSGWVVLMSVIGGVSPASDSELKMLCVHEWSIS